MITSTIIFQGYLREVEAAHFDRFLACFYLADTVFGHVKVIGAITNYSSIDITL